MVVVSLEQYSIIQSLPKGIGASDNASLRPLIFAGRKGGSTVQSGSLSAGAGVAIILLMIWLLLLASLVVPVLWKLYRLLSRSFLRTISHSLDGVNQVTGQR